MDTSRLYIKNQNKQGYIRWILKYPCQAHCKLKVKDETLKHRKDGVSIKLIHIASGINQIIQDCIKSHSIQAIKILIWSQRQLWRLWRIGALSIRTDKQEGLPKYSSNTHLTFSCNYGRPWCTPQLNTLPFFPVSLSPFLASSTVQTRKGSCPITPLFHYNGSLQTPFFYFILIVSF